MFTGGSTMSLFFLLVGLFDGTAAINCPNSIVGATIAQQLLDQHNTNRSNLARGLEPKAGGGFAPAASNMYKLSYDCGVEASAQAWASQCTFSHSNGNNGENLYWIWGSGDMSAATQMPNAAPSWWSEYFTLGPNGDPLNRLTSDEWNKGYGHWSQMAWASTTLLGCGFGNCTYQGQNAAYVVCQYSGPGNYIDAPIYNLGSPCSSDSACTTIPGSTCSIAEGLCVAGQ